MNGNVTWDGAKADMDWMKRIGIGGLQAFDAGLGTPKLVKTRLPYMSPGWKSVFAKTANYADRLGLELGIASSPGWSVTGGPWVLPRDAMKKAVWSITRVAGGRALTIKLPPPPSTTSRSRSGSDERGPRAPRPPPPTPNTRARIKKRKTKPEPVNQSGAPKV